VRSYIKIYGPPVLEAIKTMEKIAVDMPEVCIMDTIIVQGISPRIARDIGLDTYDSVGNYFRGSGIPVKVERCKNIISKSGEALGEYDFFFEWFKDPSQAQLNELIGKLDEELAPLGCYYTITTK